MLVGTTENNIPFYVKQGFDKYEKTIKNYFVDNYDELTAYTGLDDKDITNYFLVAQYIKCKEKYTV